MFNNVLIEIDVFSRKVYAHFHIQFTLLILNQYNYFCAPRCIDRTNEQRLKNQYNDERVETYENKNKNGNNNENMNENENKKQIKKII